MGCDKDMMREEGRAIATSIADKLAATITD